MFRSRAVYKWCWIPTSASFFVPTDGYKFQNIHKDIRFIWRFFQYQKNGPIFVDGTERIAAFKTADAGKVELSTRHIFVPLIEQSTIFHLELNLKQLQTS